MLKQKLNNINKGVVFMLIAAFSSACMGGFAKVLTDYMTPLEIVFFRNFIGVFLILSTIYKHPIIQKGGKPFLLIFRGVVGFLALLAWFYNVAHIPLADAVTFSNTSPIFTALFAYLVLGEKIGTKGWLAIALGFIGLILIIKPSGLSLTKTDLLGIFSGLGAGLAYTSIRELRKLYDTRSIVLSFMITGTLGPLFLTSLPFRSESLDFLVADFVMPSGIVWLYIAGLGIFATLMQTFLTKAYAETKAGIVGAVSYTGILFSLLIGVLLGDNFPDMLGFFGIILIICGGILVAKDK